MNKNEAIIKYSFLGGAVYFFCISFLHLSGIKIPGFYIYYNVPSHQYQDQIISFLVFGWALFFFGASKHKPVRSLAVFAGFIAILGLANINISNDFETIAQTSSAPFWIQTFLLFVYIVWLFLFHLRSKKPGETS